MSSILEEIRNAEPETKDFPHKVGDKTFAITVKKFQPGTAARLRKTALIKLYKVVKAEAVPLSETTETDFDAQMEAQESNVAELNENFCDAVIDKKTGKNYMTVEDAQELFYNEFKKECVDYAIGGATPPDPDNLTEEEGFSDPSTEPGE